MVFLAAVAAAGAVATVADAQDPPPSPPDSSPRFVGKKLPYINIEKWYSKPVFNLGSLNRQKWVLVLVNVGDPILKQLLPLLESVHRPHTEGGPCIVLYTKETDKEIRAGLKKLGKTKLPLIRDRRFLTHLKLKVAVKPYFYFVGEDGLVTWQGIAGLDITERFEAIKKPGDDGGGSGKGGRRPPKDKPRAPLPKDYSKQVDRAIKKRDTAEQVRLLRLAHLGTTEPGSRTPRRLWQTLMKTLDIEAEKIEKTITAKRYAAARKRLVKQRDAFGQFPPAVRLWKMFNRLADLEGQPWYDKAVLARTRGDVDVARRELERILAHYADTPMGAKARELLETLK